MRTAGDAVPDADAGLACCGGEGLDGDAGRPAAQSAFAVAPAGSAIASYIIAAEECGFDPIPIFLLARDNAVIGDDPARVMRNGLLTVRDSARHTGA